MTRKKICIIGAGLGGLSAGLLLSKKGYKVTIFEKENIIGGRALALDGNTLTLEKYRKILSIYNMAVPFSEPSLEEIFDIPKGDLRALQPGRELKVITPSKPGEITPTKAILQGLEKSFLGKEFKPTPTTKLIDIKFKPSKVD